MMLGGADPHGLTCDEASSIHVYTQETEFYRVLNAFLRGTDRSMIEPYKPCARLLLPQLHSTRPQLTAASRQVPQAAADCPPQNPPLRHHAVPRRRQGARPALPEIRNGKARCVVARNQHRVPR